MSDQPSNGSLGAAEELDVMLGNGSSEFVNDVAESTVIKSVLDSEFCEIIDMIYSLNSHVRSKLIDMIRKDRTLQNVMKIKIVEAKRLVEVERFSNGFGGKK